MESPILKRIAEFLQEQKKHKQWRAVFIILAVFVGVGTVTALRMMGLAMTHKERVLHCQLQLHEHEKSCYDRDKNLICGYADYVVHKHNDDCYNADLKLVCKLPEIEKHEHTKECYNKTVTLVCGQEETAGHEHTDQCYTSQKGDLNCKKPEHSHSDACYDEEGNLICGMEEHQHDDNCYKWEDVLTCKIKEGEGGHTHSDECYVEQEGLTCGQLEMHTHTDKCFEKIDKNGKDAPENLRLICGKIQLEEHIHTEAAGCLETVEAAPGEITQEPEADDETDGSSEEGEIFSTDLDGEKTEGEDALEGEDGEEGSEAEGEENSGNGEAMEGEEDAGTGEEGEAGTNEETEGEEAADPEVYEESKTYEGLGYIVTASYNKDANIPEEAKLIAEQITEVTDSEDYKKHETEFKKSMGDENATMSALFKIGFYVEGEEVEPETPVLVTIQFVDKNGLPEGTPIKVVHFGENGTEIIDGGKAESGSTSFKTNGFSVFGVGFNKEADEDRKIHLSETFKYEEDDAFDITFHVEGEAVLTGDTSAAVNDSSRNEEESKESEEAMKNEGALPPLNVENGEEVSEEKSTKEEGSTEEKNLGKSAEGTESKVTSDNLEFHVDIADKDSKEYTEFADYADQIGELDELLRMQMLSYSITLDGNELDISNCDVTAEVTMTDTFQEKVEKSLPSAVAYLAEDSKQNDVKGASQTDSSEPAIKDDQKDNVKKEDDKEDSGIRVYGDDETNIVEDDIEIKDKTEIEVTAAEILEKNEINEVDDIILNEENKSATMRFAMKSNKLLLRSAEKGEANPIFKVEYYANIPKVVKSGGSGTQLNVINTSNESTAQEQKGGGKGALPVNGMGKTESPNGKQLKNIYLNNNGVVQTETTPMKVYATKDFEYKNAPSLMYFDCLTENPGYTLNQIWVKYQKDPTSTDDDGFKPVGKAPNAEGWYIYEDAGQSEMHFTNRKVTAEKQKDYIFINTGTTIRLIYNTVNKDNNSFDAKMYDYNITGGKTSDVWNTAQQGINIGTNYKGSGAKYAFGNANTGTGLDSQKWGANVINKYNGKDRGGQDSYQGCAFGMVSGVGNDGNVIFDDGINGLKIFGSNPLNGKDIYAGSKLNFKRTGDTYTLSKATVKRDNDEVSSVNGLDTFKLASKLWSNDFWPFDQRTDASDPKFGGSETVKRTGGTFPPSDNGIAHNSYFGMYYAVEFNLDKDYTGPLEYLFFGDDDMWVFLDGKLICDIGGVHSSVGEYVNLWDWLGASDKGKSHTLQFFYTERGASGSSCWMQFTLPSVTSVPLEQNTGTLEISKAVSYEDSDAEVMADDEFKFHIKLTKPNGNSDVELLDDYSYTKYDASNNEIGRDIILWSGSDFTLKKGEKIIIKYLPIGTKYTITEAEDPDYNPKYSIEQVKGGNTTSIEDTTENKTVTGTIGEKGVQYKVKYENVYTIYALPETGGSGMMIYTIAGVLCILLGAGFMYTKKAKERRV